MRTGNLERFNWKPNAPRLVVNVKLHPPEVPKRALMMLRLKSQVPLHVDLHPRERAVQISPQAKEMLLHQAELAIWLCAGQ